MEKEPVLRYILVVPAYKQVAVNSVLEKLVARAKSLYQIDSGCSRFGTLPPSHFFCPRRSPRDAKEHRSLRHCR